MDLPSSFLSADHSDSRIQQLLFLRCGAAQMLYVLADHLRMGASSLFCQGSLAGFGCGKVYNYLYGCAVTAHEKHLRMDHFMFNKMRNDKNIKRSFRAWGSTTELNPRHCPRQEYGAILTETMAYLNYLPERAQMYAVKKLEDFVFQARKRTERSLHNDYIEKYTL